MDAIAWVLPPLCIELLPKGERKATLSVKAKMCSLTKKRTFEISFFPSDSYPVNVTTVVCRLPLD